MPVLVYQIVAFELDRKSQPSTSSKTTFRGTANSRRVGSTGSFSSHVHIPLTLHKDRRPPSIPWTISSALAFACLLHPTPHPRFDFSSHQPSSVTVGSLSGQLSRATSAASKAVEMACAKSR